MSYIKEEKVLNKSYTIQAVDKYKHGRTGRIER